MGLEVASYITGLNTSWPLAGDTKSQGDDHLRLIKSVLTVTFPNASKPFYIPSAETSSGAMVLDATDQNNFIGLDTSGGDLAVTLPAGLGTNDKGWECEIYKIGGPAGSGIVISPTSGNIFCQSGSVATMRIERLAEPVRFKWTGVLWLGIKLGPPVGSSLNWDGGTAPFGYRVADGTTYSATTFAELNAALGTTTLRDKRGRSEVGVDASNVNMSSTSWGGAVTLGSTKSGGTATLATANLPPYTPQGTNGTVTVNSSNFSPAYSLTASSTGGGGFAFNYPASVGTLVSTGSGPTFTGTAQGGTSTPFSVVQPSLATYKLVRVC